MKPAVDVEVNTSQEAMAIVPLPPQQSVSLFRTDDPREVIKKASEIATAMRDTMKAQGLISTIQGKEYPKCEAWTLCGTILGVFPVLCWTRPIEGGWEARVEARMRDGSIVGAAEAQCLNTERNWSNRDNFALRSMAQTRATAKALRMPLGFIMSLAGYQATPAEEMMQEEGPQRPNQSERIKAAVQQKATPPAQPAAPAVQTPQSIGKGATAKTREWMIKALEPVKALAVAYFQSIKKLGANTTLADLDLKDVPTTRAGLDDLAGKIRAFAEEPPTGNPEEPPTEEPPTNGEAWRTCKMPWGAHKGVELDKIDLPTDKRVRYLYGLWANLQIGPTCTPEFRAILDDMGRHYQFTKKE